MAQKSTNPFVKDEVSFGSSTGFVKQDEDMVDEQLKQEQLQRSPFVDKFTQLWFACYYERRLTKQKVESADLTPIIEELRNYFASENVDFRRAIPLLQGLHVLFTRQLRYMLADSESVLKSMTDPTELIKLEGDDEVEGHADNVSKRRAGGDRDRSYRDPANKKSSIVNPKNFDWFLAGIDKERLDGMLRTGIKPDEMAHGEMKLEDFAMVRDGDARHDNLNDLPFGGLNQLGVDQAMGGASAFRELPGEEMDEALRNDYPQEPVMGDHSVFDNLDLFDQSRFGASDDKLRPIGEKREDLINFEGFGLDFEEKGNQHEGSGVGHPGAAKGVKNKQKLKKEFEKLMLGSDAETAKEAPKRATQRVKQEKQIAQQRIDQKLVLTSNDFFDGDSTLLQDMSTGVQSRGANTFSNLCVTSTEEKIAIFDQLKLEAEGNFSNLFDMPETKEEKSLFDLPDLFKEEAGQDNYMDADNYQQDDGQDEPPQMMNEVKHYSADRIDELHEEMKTVLKPSSVPTPFKEVVESLQLPQKETKRSAATNLFMKSLILAQEGKIELKQTERIEDQGRSLAFPDLAIKCFN